MSFAAVATPGNDCGPLHLVGCAKNVVGGAAGAVAGGAIDAFVKSTANAAEGLLKTLSTVWMKVPSPTLTDGQRPSGVIAAITTDLGFYTMVFAMLGIMLAAAKMALTNRGDALVPAARMLVTLIIVSAAGATVVATAVGAGDTFAPWIINRATDQEFSTGAARIITGDLLVSKGSGLGLFTAIAALLGSVAQIVFMLLRGAMITLLMCVLPTIAATSAMQGGSAAFRRATGWLLAFVLYKPVAAVVYSVGFLMLKGNVVSGGQLSKDDTDTMSMLMGLVVIILAALTLPALIKFLVPMASAGVSSMFSGAAVGAAALAAGAAVVSLGGMGAGAGGGGAAAAGGKAGGAGAAPQGGGSGTQSPAGATGTPPTSGGITGDAGPISSGGAAGGPAPGGTSSSTSGSSGDGAAPDSAGGAALASGGTSTPSSGSQPPPSSGGAGGGPGQRWARAARGAAQAARDGNAAADDLANGPDGARGESS